MRAARAAWPGVVARGAASYGPLLTTLPAGGWEVLPGRGVGTACRRGPAWGPWELHLSPHDLSAEHLAPNPVLFVTPFPPHTPPRPSRSTGLAWGEGLARPRPWRFPRHSARARSGGWRVCRRWASLCSPAGPASASAGAMAVSLLLLPRPSAQGLAQGRQPVNVAPSDTGQLDSPLPRSAAASRLAPAAGGLARALPVPATAPSGHCWVGRQWAHPQGSAARSTHPPRFLAPCPCDLGRAQAPPPLSLCSVIWKPGYRRPSLCGKNEALRAVLGARLVPGLPAAPWAAGEAASSAGESSSRGRRRLLFTPKLEVSADCWVPAFGRGGAERGHRGRRQLQSLAALGQALSPTPTRPA